MLRCLLSDTSGSGHCPKHLFLPLDHDFSLSQQGQHLCFRRLAHQIERLLPMVLQLRLNGFIHRHPSLDHLRHFFSPLLGKGEVQSGLGCRLAGQCEAGSFYCQFEWIKG
jgi:hypothetical protein